jgi:hypothetical protein
MVKCKGSTGAIMALGKSLPCPLYNWKDQGNLVGDGPAGYYPGLCPAGPPHRACDRRSSPDPIKTGGIHADRLPLFVRNTLEMQAYANATTKVAMRQVAAAMFGLSEG